MAVFFFRVVKDDFGNPFSVAAVIKDIKGGELNNPFDVVDFKGVVDVELENAHVLFNNGVETVSYTHLTLPTTPYV